MVTATRLLLGFSLLTGPLAYEGAAGPPPPSAVTAWDQYVRQTERRIEDELNGREFLAVSSLAPAHAARARSPRAAAGLLYVVPVATTGGPGADEVPGGLRHHWLAAVFVPGVKVEDVLAFVQDYDHQAGVFEDVLVSRLLARDGDYFEPLLRLRRTKVITAVYDTTHAVHYKAHGGGRASSRSVATRIVELERTGGADAYRPRPDAKDRGFLWRLNSYWRFLAVPGGVIVECESTSMSRAIPTGLSWLIGHYVNSIPKESLERTLTGIKNGVLARAGRTK